MSLDISSDSLYQSAPTSPSRTNLDSGMGFYSVPTSPSWEIILKTTHEHDDLETTSPRRTHEDEDEDGAEYSDDLFDFEFETSRRFNVDDYRDLEINAKPEQEMEQEKQEKQEEKPQYDDRKGSLPAMAFADELFCEGKVMPLKPPPRLECNNNVVQSSCSGSGSTRAIKNPFPRRSLWNDDFDPFMAAWKNVKGDETSGGNWQGKKNHRRARSMVPLQASTSLQPNNDPPTCNHLDPFSPNPKSPKEPTVSYPNLKKGAGGFQSMREVGKSPIKLIEPKGVLFARRARMVKMDPEWPKKGSKSAKVEAGGGEDAIARASGEACGGGMEKKSKSKRNFLFKSSSSRKTISNEHEQKEQQGLEIPKKPKMMRKSSVKSMGLLQCNEAEKGVRQVTQMTLAQCKPKLYLCMGGFAAKHVK
ncbi:hypothetical protein Tsubulata_007853 [Turnera subulata]|uniref:Uncharacterized protein n=1 Tax=Turnera subulata TaxID=218843 RepID=A0A9Q0GE57_9ROSI|nr:hypothetical protein Tsubulata_007853 [Turnera subulata]